ncbi:MAG: hypothetical protein EU533_04075 [Promethearchaeota archaeon]|nr:MAG: hypothetical protein EU533_04075 [Candidatus Lokiarchaeota archaeon]
MNLNDLKSQIPSIFEKVRKDVKKVYRRRRAGLSLGLVDLGISKGGFVGGLHFHPGTDIIMNISPLKLIIETQSYEIAWSYTYHILLHEYIHSLGILDEQKCRILTLKLTEEIFENSNHPAVILAKNGIGSYLPTMELRYLPPERKPEGIKIEYLPGFDKESYEFYS